MGPSRRRGPRRGKADGPVLDGTGSRDRTKREAAQKATKALIKGAEAARGRGKRKSWKYQGASGSHN